VAKKRRKLVESLRKVSEGIGRYRNYIKKEVEGDEENEEGKTLDICNM